MKSECEKAWAWDLLVILGERDWDGLLGLALGVYIYIASESMALFTSWRRRNREVLSGSVS